MAKSGYHKGNFYRRVLEVQQEYLKYANSGRTTQYIFATYIYPRFYISRSTFYSWLAINARAELKKLEAEHAFAVPTAYGLASRQGA